MKNEWKEAYLYLERFELTNKRIGETERNSDEVQSAIDYKLNLMESNERTLNIIIICATVAITSMYSLFKILRYKAFHTRAIIESDILLSYAYANNACPNSQKIALAIKCAKDRDGTFFMEFNEIFPSFKINVSEKYPRLSAREIELCTT